MASSRSTPAGGAPPRPTGRSVPPSAAVVLGAVLLAACGSSSATGPTTTGSTGTTSGVGAVVRRTPSPPTPRRPCPSHGAYLGAWLHPHAGSGGSFAEEQATVSSVLAATGRPLGLLHVYSPWARPAPVDDLRAIVGDGSVPILDWGCGPDLSQVTSGADDALITAYAQALRGFQGPVFLRWCWEMNLVGQHPQVGGPTGVRRRLGPHPRPLPVGRRHQRGLRVVPGPHRGRPGPVLPRGRRGRLDRCRRLRPHRVVHLRLPVRRLRADLAGAGQADHGGRDGRRRLRPAGLHRQHRQPTPPASRRSRRWPGSTPPGPSRAGSSPPPAWWPSAVWPPPRTSDRSDPTFPV